VINVNNLTIKLNVKTEILSRISVDFEQAKIHAVVGPNGSGKTTLLKSIVGIYEPTGKETIKLNGRCLKDFNQFERSLAISYVESQHSCPFAYTVRDVISWGRWIHHRGRPTADDKNAVEKAADTMGITSLLDRAITTLSTGELKKTHLALSLSSGARYFVWDEPFAPLDLKSSAALAELIKRLTLEGATFIISCHDLAMALRFTDKLSLLSSGQIRWHGSSLDPEAISAIEREFNVKSRRDGIYFSDPS